MFNQQAFKAYDVRGCVGIGFDHITAYNIGKCFANLILIDSNKKICVGYDGRHSSQIFRDYLTEGLYAGGADIIDIGLVPKPLLTYTDYIIKPAASIMITASHNPKEDNGFKFFVKGESFAGQDIQNLKDLISKNYITKVAIQSREYTKLDLSDQYLNYIFKHQIINPSLKIIWDNGNGSAGPILKRIIEKLPNNNILINETVDGDFPNRNSNPCEPGNLQNLQNLVKENNADLGIGFDGDGDRIGVIDDAGNYVDSDKLLCMFALEIDYIKKINLLSEQTRIIFDTRASAVIVKYMQQKGFAVDISRSGHCNFKQKIIEKNADAAGEMSGHIFFNDKFYGQDDALYASLRLLNLLYINYI